MQKDNLRDTIEEVIEEVCTKVLKDMNMTEEQMMQAAIRLSEYTMSVRSKAELEKVKEFAKSGVPEDLMNTYHMIFLSGYQCGTSDEQRKRC